MSVDLPPATATLVAALGTDEEPTKEQAVAAVVEIVGVIVGACSALERIATALEREPR